MDNKETNKLMFSEGQLELLETVYIQDSMEKFDNVYAPEDTDEVLDEKARAFFLEAATARAKDVANSVARASVAQDALNEILAENDNKKTKVKPKAKTKVSKKK